MLVASQVLSFWLGFRQIELATLQSRLCSGGGATAGVAQLVPGKRSSNVCHQHACGASHARSGPTADRLGEGSIHSRMADKLWTL